MAHRNGAPLPAPHRTSSSGSFFAPRRRTIAASIAVATLATLAFSAPVSASNRLFQNLPSTHRHVRPASIRTCTKAVSPGIARCDAWMRVNDPYRLAVPLRHPAAIPHMIGNGGAYDPSYLDSAYNVASAVAAGRGGSGQIVALVEAYDDPNLASDLAAYRSHFGLPACPTGPVSPTNSGCVLEKVNESGAAGPLPTPDIGWSTESSLDVEMVSAICAKCQILVVEASSPFISDLGASVNTAVALGANVVSNSYGSGEYPSETSDASAYYNHPGVAIVASSGDAGYGVQFPAAAPTVTAVGGTTLDQLTNSGTRNAVETAWSGAGSGCSQFEPKPTWQTDTGCAHRSVADVAAVADPNTGVWVYDTFGYSGFEIFGGTSVAAPIIGSMYALAGNSKPSATPMSSVPYASRDTLIPVTTGSNSSCGTYLCDASQSQDGYNGPTGLGTPGGTPNSLSAFTAGAAGLLAPSPPTLLSITPATASVDLTWSPPSSSGSSPVAAYDVFVGTSPHGEAATPANASPVTGTSYDVTGLHSNTTYYFTVEALNGVSASAPSNELSASTPVGYVAPGAPLIIGASTGNGSVALVWSAPTDSGGGVSGYNIYAGTIANGESALPVNATLIGGTSYVVTGLSNGLTYYFTIRAVNPAGMSLPSVQFSARPATTPSSPLALLGRSGSPSGVALSWNAPSSNGGALVTSYVIYRSTAPGREVRWATVSCSSSSCSFNDVTTSKGTIYYYRVAAINSIGTSAPSNQTFATAR